MVALVADVKELNGISVGDVVVNEYGHLGAVVALLAPDEAKVAVVNYGLKDDFDYCAASKCRIATEMDKLAVFN